MDVPESLGSEGLGECVQVRLQLEGQQWWDGTTGLIHTRPTNTGLTDYGLDHHRLTK